MKITAIDTQPHPVWFASGRSHAPFYYRAVLPARMVGGSVQSEILIGRDGEKPKPVKLFEPGALDEFIACDAITVCGLGTPSLIAYREFMEDAISASASLRAFVSALIVSGHDVRIEADDNFFDIDHQVMLHTSLMRPTGIEAIVRGTGMAPARAAKLFDEEAEAMWREGRIPAAKLQKALREHDVMLKVVKEFLVSTKPLGNVFRARYPAARVRVAPNVIDTDDFKSYARINDGIVRIGFAGTITHQLDLTRIALPALQWIRNKVRFDQSGVFVELHFWGWHPGLPMALFRSDEFSPGNYEFEGLHYTYHGTTDILSFQREIAMLDVAFAPLLDDSFNSCKSQQKWFEHSLNGTAMVLSKLPPYDCVQHGVTGMLAADVDGFKHHLLRLVTEPDLRRSIGEAARLAVLKHHTVDACRQVWLDAVWAYSRDSSARAGMV